MTNQIKAGHHKFYIGENENTPQAEITFKYLDENTIDVNKTFVDPSLRGGGVAKKLFNKVIQKAEDENLKIVPSCSYVTRQFEKDESLAPLLAE